MLRRSTPALLGLFVCLFAAHLSSASGALGLDETKIRVSLASAETLVRLEVGNGTGRALPARLRLELLDPRDKVKAATDMAVRLRPGANPFEIPIKLPYSELPASERREFPWFRLRYSVTPDAAGTAAFEGVVSLSRVMPDLFELRVVSSRRARAGSNFRARVRTANPVTQRPVGGVAIEAKLSFDSGGDEKLLSASATTDGDGFASLDFPLPHAPADEGEADLEVSARRGSFLQEADADVEFAREPRVLLTTDKPLYQPGQTVHMRALVFDPSERALAGAEVTFKVEDEEGTDSFSESLKTSRFGVASADWRIPESTRLGTYTLKLEMDGDKYDIDYGAVTGFKISRYDLPNFSVEAKPDRPFYLAGQRPAVEVRADYLFGQPVRRGSVRVVHQTERRWDYKAQKYVTAEHPAVEGELDDTGRFVARLDLSGEQEELDASGWQRFRDLEFAAYVKDPTTNRTEERRFSLRLSKEPIHIYVSEGRFRQAGGLPLAFYLSTFYADGTPAACDVTVSEEGLTRTEVTPEGGRRHADKPGRALIRVRTNRYGVAKVVGPALARDEKRDNLALHFSARDGQGREGHHGEDFWLERYGGPAPEIRVETDKTIYREGEPVGVEVTSDSERLSVVVEAFSQGRVVFSKMVHLAGGRASLHIPAGPDLRDVVNVSATSVTPAGRDREHFSSGSRAIIFPRDRELKLDVRLSQKSFRPGDEAGAQFALRTADGRRAAGALGVVVFDKAVEERARTEGETAGAFGFAGSLEQFRYGGWNIGGVTRGDVERLDPRRTLPEGFETVAEMLYNGERDAEEQSVSTGTEFALEQPEVFSQLIGARLKPLRAAVESRYARSGEYPSDASSLTRLLAEEGVDFASLRDPWGQAYRPRFRFEREAERLELYSDGADERPGTEDDFIAAGFGWPYFRRTGEAINRAAADYSRRTGGFLRDAGALGEELRRAGLAPEVLRDPWGRPYRFDFGVGGTHYSISVESAGPDAVFAPRGASGSDDFTVWVLLTDYFADSRKALDEALALHLRETRDFPRTREALAAALAKSSVSLDALRDGWGRPVYAEFATGARFSDRMWIEDRRRFDASGGTHRSAQAVSQTVHTITLRSAGPDGREGTPDDFTLGHFTSLGAEQAARDASPAPPAPATTLSGGSGAIEGTITDVTGAAIYGTAVTAKHNFAPLEYTAKSGEDGTYLLRNLASGVYTLTFEAGGFRRAIIEQVRVFSSNLTKVDATLEVGGVTETVSVTAEANVLNTSSLQLLTGAKKSGATRAPLSTPRLREFFPETLVWSPELETAADGTARLNFKLADNITTWKMSVIASTEDGRLGVVERDLLAFQPFFVEHDPPRVLTEGDEISLPVVLRNYLERAQGVEVEMKPESWFTLSGEARRRAEVAAGDAARPTFDFRAVASVRDGRQRVTALGADASDAVEKPVTVHPDGEERSQTDGTIFSDTGRLNARLPADTIPGSVRGELKLYPNLLAHLLEGVEAIMQRPYGCGEQTISSTYPSVLVLEHYGRTNGAGTAEAAPPVVARARRYARLGYERLLGYRATGGGFTYWGRGEADLALTAYALRFLSDARRVMEVDEDVLKETREWLLRQQRADGSWPSQRWGGGEDKLRTSLNTAFVARVLAATQKPAEAPRGTAAQSPARQGTPAKPHAEAPPPQTAAPTAGTQPQATPLQRALQYLAARAGESDEPYLIASYALAAADAGERASAARAAARLRTLSKEEGEGSYWALETNTPFYGWGLAGRIETTALVVQALVRDCGLRQGGCGVDADEGRADTNRRLIGRALLFLLRSKDRYGVWYSTQATINVFDALLSTVASRDVAGGQPSSGAAQGASAEVFVNGRRAGALTLPPPEKPSVPLTLDLSAFLGPGDNRVEVRSSGPARQTQAQLVTTFYVPWPARTPPGDGAPAEAVGREASKPKGAGSLRLSVGFDRANAGVGDEVTCSVEAERIGHRGYGMLLAEVGLPPGADVDRASLERAMKASDWALSSYDVLPDRLVVYLWPQGGGTRFQFKFRPRYGLNALTAPSQLYDYYNPEARSVVPPTRFVVR